MATAAIIGTFDTKGTEYKYIKDILEREGLSTLTIHVGVFEPAFEPDVSNDQVARAGGSDIGLLACKKDRGYAMDILSAGLLRLLPSLYDAGLFDGVISLGGSGGTALVTPAMRALPLGVPKIMVTTMASSDVRRYVGTSDIVMIPSVVDVAGINYISSKVFSNAAHALAGMIRRTDLGLVGQGNGKAGSRDRVPDGQQGHKGACGSSKPMIAATMYGVTTPCVNMAREYLEKKGYEVLVFHASGIGGQSMEALIRTGVIKGVLDITTTEWCDELMGGIMAAGPDRNEAAARLGIPQVVSVGAMDMVTFGAMDSVPEKYKGRNLRMHNPQITIMRTSKEENRAMGLKLAEKLNLAKGKTLLLLPLRGVSMVDAEGQPFYGPEEDRELFSTLKENIHNPMVEILEMDAHINDEAFAMEAARKLAEMIET